MNPVNLAGSSTPDAASSASDRKLREAAGEFESMLLASLWKSMKKAFSSPEASDSDPAHDTIDDWGIDIMAGAVGKAGGLGIGSMIIKDLETKTGDSAPSTASAKVSSKTADMLVRKGRI